MRFRSDSPPNLCFFRHSLDRYTCGSLTVRATPLSFLSPGRYPPGPTNSSYCPDPGSSSDRRSHLVHPGHRGRSRDTWGPPQTCLRPTPTSSLRTTTTPLLPDHPPFPPTPWRIHYVTGRALGRRLRWSTVSEDSKTRPRILGLSFHSRPDEGRSGETNHTSTVEQGIGVYRKGDP